MRISPDLDGVIGVELDILRQDTPYTCTKPDSAQPHSLVAKS